MCFLYVYDNIVNSKSPGLNNSIQKFIMYYEMIKSRQHVTWDGSGDLHNVNIISKIVLIDEDTSDCYLNKIMVVSEVVCHVNFFYVLKL